MGQPQDGERCVELYVRSLSPGGTHRQQDRVVHRLEELLSGDAIDDYDLRVWGDRIRHASPCARTVDGRHVRDRLARIRRWADEHGYSLDGVYREVDCESAITDESWTEIRFPQVALAEFVDGDLVRFTPVRDDGDDRVLRVADHLEDLSADAPRGESEDERTDRGSTDRERRADGDARRSVEAGPAEH
jgi:hypothetical protein